MKNQNNSGSGETRGSVVHRYKNQSEFPDLENIIFAEVFGRQSYVQNTEL